MNKHGEFFKAVLVGDVVVLNGYPHGAFSLVKDDPDDDTEQVVFEVSSLSRTYKCKYDIHIYIYIYIYIHRYIMLTRAPGYTTTCSSIFLYVLNK